MPILGITEDINTAPPQDPRLGARVHFDVRSLLNYNVAQLLPVGLEPRSVRWECNKDLDQDGIGACVGFACAGEVAAVPLPLFADNALGFSIYYAAQKRDPWPGENYEGTDPLSGLLELRDRGYIGAFYWSNNWQDFQLALSHIGPTLVATVWLGRMFTPDASNTIHAEGSIAGRHMYLIVENDTERQRCKIHNSWGASWGDGGEAWISWADLQLLLYDHFGEAAVITERRDPAPVPPPPEPEPEPTPPEPIPPEPQPAPGIYKRFEAPKNFRAVVNTAKVDFIAGTPVHPVGQGTVWTLAGYADVVGAADGSRVSFVMGAADFGQADVTGVPVNPHGIPSTALELVTPEPVPPEPEPEPEPEPVPPAPSRQFFASARGRTFHDEHARIDRDRLFTWQEAIDAGLRPCKVCRPSQPA